MGGTWMQVEKRSRAAPRFAKQPLENGLEWTSKGQGPRRVSEIGNDTTDEQIEDGKKHGSIIFRIQTAGPTRQALDSQQVVCHRLPVCLHISR